MITVLLYEKCLLSSSYISLLFPFRTASPCDHRHEPHRPRFKQLPLRAPTPAETEARGHGAAQRRDPQNNFKPRVGRRAHFKPGKTPSAPRKRRRWSLSPLTPLHSKADKPKHAPNPIRVSFSPPIPSPWRDLAAAMPLGEGAAGDFALPDEVLAALPRDPYEQLDLARRITAMAVAGRVSGLEREAGRLRAEAAEKDRENAELRERVGLLDTALQETNARLRAALEDNVGAGAPGGPAVHFGFGFGWRLDLTVGIGCLRCGCRLSSARSGTRWRRRLRSWRATCRRCPHLTPLLRLLHAYLSV
jgi:hypothetical protein